MVRYDLKSEGSKKARVTIYVNKQNLARLVAVYGKGMVSKAVDRMIEEHLAGIKDECRTTYNAFP